MQPIKSLLFSVPALCSVFLGCVSAPVAFGQAAELSWPTEFVPPDVSDRRRPDGRSRGGASRGGCDLPEAASPLTALVPSTLKEVESADGELSAADPTSYEAVLSLTSDAHPDFWFYVPYALDGSLDVEFVLQDTGGNTLYQNRFAPDTESAGVLQVALPDSSPPLPVGDPHRWFFVVYCEPNAPVFVEGWVQRVELEAPLQAQLERADLSQRVELYADYGIWQDALDVLAELYREQPESAVLREAWLRLLASAGLAEVADESLMAD